MKSTKRILYKITTASTTAAAYLAGGAFFLFLLLALLTPEKTPRGQFTDPLKYWTDDQYFIENFTTAANAAEPETIATCSTDWECEQCGAACENPDYEEETF